MYYGTTEFVNDRLIEYCLEPWDRSSLVHGPYRKNDQAWIEQKKRRCRAQASRVSALRPVLLPLRRLPACTALSRLFVNFFQPSFKLAAKQSCASVTKRYYPPQTPCERLLGAESMPQPAKLKLREIADTLDPLKLLEEMRAMQAHLTTLADGETLPASQPSRQTSRRSGCRPLQCVAGRRGTADVLPQQCQTALLA